MHSDVFSWKLHAIFYGKRHSLPTRPFTIDKLHVQWLTPVSYYTIAFSISSPLLLAQKRVLCKCQSIICKGTSICPNGMYQFIADHIVSITPIRQWPTDYCFNLNIVQFIRIERNWIESNCIHSGIAMQMKFVIIVPSLVPPIIECHKGTHETRTKEKKSH